MNKFILGLTTIVLLASCSAKNDSKPTSATNTKKTIEFSFSNPDIKEQNKIAYALGYKYAEATRELEMNEESQKHFILGIQKFFTKPEKNTPRDISAYSRKIDKIIQENRAKKVETESKKGELFVKSLLEDGSYKQTKSGLLYKIIKIGKTGNNLTTKPYIQMNYVASKTTGEEFESTLRGDPRIIHKNGLLKAWLEAFELAGRGGEIEVVAPPSLTYGKNGALPRVLPGEYLIYKINFFKTFKKHPNKR